MSHNSPGATKNRDKDEMPFMIMLFLIYIKLGNGLERVEIISNVTYPPAVHHKSMSFFGEIFGSYFEYASKTIILIFVNSKDTAFYRNMITFPISSYISNNSYGRYWSEIFFSHYLYIFFKNKQ